MKAGERNYGCRVKDDILYRGMRTLVMENDFLRASTLLDKGSDIFEFLYKPLDLDLVWLSPFGINPPSRFVLTGNQPGGRFMDFYEGGWQEIFPNGGGPSSWGGAQFGQHDEVALLPWEFEILDDSPTLVRVRLYTSTRLAPLALEKEFTLKKGEPVLYIREKAINRSSQEIPAIWGHHLAYGKPFLDESCTINIPAKKGLTYNIPGVMDEDIDLGKEIKWPVLTTSSGKEINLSVIPPRDTRTTKFLYLSGLDRGIYEIDNSNRKVKLKVEWDHKVMPYVWYWQEFNNSEGYPWYGMARVFGLEPFSTDIMGLEDAIKKNRHIRLEPGAGLDFTMDISVSGL